MFALKSRHALQPERRSLLPLLLALAVPLAMAACDGADNALAPTTEPAAEPAAGLTEPDYALAAGTLQRIAFTSYRTGGGDVYKMDPQGNNVVRLTSFASADLEPAWSHDNKRIAMVRPRKDASNTVHNDIYVIDADGTHGHWARSTPFPYNMMDPSWSPDGSRLALTVAVQGGWYLGWMDLATGQMGLFNAAAGGRPGRRPSYDPTGNKIAYIGYRSMTVEQISADGVTHKTLRTSTLGVGDPTFSPDGKKIAFYERVSFRSIGEPNLEIFVMSLAGGTATQVTNSPGYDVQPSWSPDGSRIAFTSDRSGLPQIWTMNATGGNLLRITHTAKNEGYPAWSH
jgi:Tol biopolymer transport system component